MGSLFVKDDLYLLGYENVLELSQTDPSVIGFEAKIQAGVRTESHHFIYIKSDATKNDLERIEAKLGSLPNLYILTGKSGASIQLLKQVFKRASAVYPVEDLVWDRVVRQFQPYVDGLKSNLITESNFVAPRGDDPVPPMERLDVHLQDKLNAGTQQLIVVKAPAGVGKTTLSRWLAKKIANASGQKRVIPVYLESSHWTGKVDTMDGTWQIIQNSLRTYDPNSSISRPLFERALQRGFIAFIFDGFDELCGNRKFPQTARDVWESIVSLSQDSDAKVLLTTRTHFWDSEIGPDVGNAQQICLLPFNPQQAKDYIGKVFAANSGHFQTARAVYGNLTAAANAPKNSGGARVNFWTLPIAVALVCQAVKEGLGEADLAGITIESLLEMICERETSRQNLSLTGKRQLEILQELALLGLGDADCLLDSSYLDAAGVPVSDLSSFESHPLVRLEENRLHFAYEFLGPYLRALAILKDVASSTNTLRDGVVQIMASQENGKGFLIDHLVRLCTESGATEPEVFVRKAPANNRGARSFLFHLFAALSGVNPNVKTAAERTRFVLGSLSRSTNQIELVQERFVGLFERLDFAGVLFDRCEFSDVSFAACKFGGAKFVRCVFDGVIDLGEDCDVGRPGEVDFISCEFRGDSRVALERFEVGSSDELADLVKDLMSAGLSKFWHNGNFKASIRKQDWSRGVLGRSRHKSLVAEVFAKVGLISEVEISGVAEGGYAYHRDSISDLQNFMDNRALTGRIRTAFGEFERIFGRR